jgi:predicted amidohydrolase
MDELTVAAAAVQNLAGKPEEALANMERWMRTASDAGADLILFPELNVSGHIPNGLAARVAEPVPGPSTAQIIPLARQYGLQVAFGIIERDGERVYCTHVLVDGHGILGKQRKIHVPAQELPYWQAGDAIEVFDAGKAKIGIAICRDAFFDEFTRTLYFMGAEVVLMPFGYYNVPRSRYLRESIHGMSIVKASWTNGFYSVVCNSAAERPPGEYEPEGRKFPGWAGVISPWGRVMQFVDDEGNDERLVVETLKPEELLDRREHPNFLAEELRPELYRFGRTD